MCPQFNGEDVTQLARRSLSNTDARIFREDLSKNLKNPKFQCFFME